MAASLLAGAVVLALPHTVGAAPMAPGSTPTMLAGDVVARIAAGQPVELDGTTIVGDLDLGAIDTATRVVRCTNCTFHGSIRASNVVFNRAVDLSGATIDGTFTADDAVFRDAFLMHATAARAASILGATSFTLAAFHGGANFEALRLLGDADFGGAQFLGGASFAGADVGGEARFDSATFAGRALFSGSSVSDQPEAGQLQESGCPVTTRGSFGGAASFVGVSFAEKADFRQRCFAGRATFRAATFGAADFSLAIFRKVAIFDDASIDGVASFRVTIFRSDVSFQHVVLRGPTDFGSAVFIGSVQLFGTSAADSFSLDGITAGGSMGFDRVRASGFQMSLDNLGNVNGESVREDVLRMVEASALSRGDLGLANDAAYLRASMQTAKASGIEHLKGVIGEQVAGYLVKPWYPLRAFLILLVMGTLIRVVAVLAPATLERQLRRPTMPAHGGVAIQVSRTSLMSASKLLLIFFRAASATLHAALRLRPYDLDAKDADRLVAYGGVILAGLEWLAFKVAAALFVLGLANSNPTFKQLLEAVVR